MTKRAVWFTSDARFAFESMELGEQRRWAARINRIAADRPLRATRAVRGVRHLFRLEADGWILLYRAPPRRGRIVIAAIARRRLERLVDAALAER